MTVDFKDLSIPKIHALLLGAVTPRPIAFASTVDKDGNVNLSPFSFFNCFGSNPPLLIFSPARRGRDNTVKNTYENVQEVAEVVINIVSYDMVQQANLASAEFPKGVNEFVKAGFTEVPSLKVKPPRVKESPVSMECKVLQVIRTGDQGGAGNLVICEVVMMHVKDEILDNDGRIDPFKLDAVARLGGDWYCRVQGDSIFKVPKPLDRASLGFDNIPEAVRNSSVLSGNDLGILGNVEKLPTDISVAHLPAYANAKARGTDEIHRLAKQYIAEGRVEDAWRVLLS
ncbi:flavin reductase family protein [Pseudochryseolinea flava]|uniref:Flavin reductase family protein n=1 Tax=Pseudochryseolinea flava TaxID=2059302 RepID=A0A364XZD5_9BACT|nr:flavin reductase family protein [Pseudochryseolinea flava]RAV98801.1 flavin reductase family protein [Pseudochryseolinea flava]